MQGIDIRIARIKAGFKQYEVAARIGVPQTVISEIEHGKRAISVEMLQRILGVLSGDHLRSESRRRCVERDRAGAVA